LRRVGASLATHIDSSLPTLKADATQLEIVLHNLLSNAIDAVTQVQRPWRRIELNAQRQGECVVVRVEDSGPGIASQVLAKLFEPFVTSKPDGMGLGLAISRSLVRARGGDLTFERSRRLRGACFVVRIPIDRAGDELS
jgi:C4-dicarboxylate-specific signal transduction histidine kinase